MTFLNYGKIKFMFQTTNQCEFYMVYGKYHEVLGGELPTNPEVVLEILRGIRCGYAGF
jgi:hypothetical protein